MNLKRENEWRRIDVNLLGKKKKQKNCFQRAKKIIVQQNGHLTKY